MKAWPLGTVLIFAGRRTDPKRVERPDPRYLGCADCGRDVVVSGESLDRAAADYQDAPVKVVCVECGVEYRKPKGLTIVDLRPGATLESTSEVTVTR